MVVTFPDWDTSLFLYLNSLHTAWLDPIMKAFSSVPIWVPMYVAVCFFIVRKYRWQSILIILLLVACIYLCDQLATVIKSVFERPRPCTALMPTHPVHLLENCPPRFSFISNHASNVFGFALFTSLFIQNKKYSFFIFTWASLVAYSRIYVGKHYPLDVMGGAVFGMLVALTCYLLCLAISSGLKKTTWGAKYAYTKK